MARSYTLGKRAEQQAETRRRIVEAAVELHRTVGPADASLSMVAERAGVQRNTLYAHFPDESSLLVGCSTHFTERHPLPEADAWRGIAGPAERLRAGLRAIYTWYGETADMTGCVLRDAERHAPTRETAERTFGPAVAAWHEVLGEGRPGAQRALLHLALGFHSWRALVQEAGLSGEAAAELLARAVEAAE